MKVRESGMPEEILWNTFFDVGHILGELRIDSSIGNVVEVGSGYGTFTLPVSKVIKGNIYAFDIEQEAIETIRRKAHNSGVSNIISEKRDFLAETSGLPDNSIDYVMLFNIMHHVNPEELLGESFRILKHCGKAGIISWRTDISTPRGPQMSIRPAPNDLVRCIDLNKFAILKYSFNLLPYHFGLLIEKKQQTSI